MNGKVDLHMHTTYSDGFHSPGELIERVKSKGIDVISITDHDNLSAIKETKYYADQVGIEVIPGVELSSETQGREIHILGYFIDIENEELERYLKFFREERFKRAVRIVRKLNLLGLSLSIDDVLKIAKNSAIGRPHIARALLEGEYISNYYEAFNKYIGNDGPAYEPKVYISPKSACKIINDANGLSFIAHPGNMPEIVVKDMIDAGIDGIEVIHPSHSSHLVKFYRGIVNEYFLLESGGSDFHGGKREDDKNLGNFYTSYSVVEAMEKRLMKNSA